MGDPTLPQSILLLTVCLLAGGLANAGERALKELAADALVREENDPLAAMVRSPSRPLFACRAVVLTELLCSTLLVEHLPLPTAAESYAALLRVGCYLLLLLAQLVLVSYFPRRLAIHAPEQVGRRLRPGLWLGGLLLAPLCLLSTALTGLLLRCCGIDPHAVGEDLSESDIRLMVDMGEETGAIEKEERELIENVFEFNNSTAADVMVHRTEVVMLWTGDTDTEIVETIRTSGLTRFPVYEEDPDDIIGVLNSRDYFLNAQSDRPKPLRELLRKAYFVPESVPADELFRDLQSRKVHFAIVVDEYGGTSGIITMEDLLEELVGNIYDEFDPQDEQLILPLSEETFRIAGAAPLEEVSAALGVEIPEEEESETLGGLILAQLPVIPADGEHPEVDIYGLHIQVEELAERRVEWAKVTLALEQPAQ